MLLHGEAVAIDMALTTELAWGRGLLSDEQRGRVLGLLRCLRLPLWHEACSVKLFMKVGRHAGGRLSCVGLKMVGVHTAIACYAPLSPPGHWAGDAMNDTPLYLIIALSCALYLMNVHLVMLSCLLLVVHCASLSAGPGGHDPHA